MSAPYPTNGLWLLGCTGLACCPGFNDYMMVGSWCIRVSLQKFELESGESCKFIMWTWRWRGGHVCPVTDAMRKPVWRETMQCLGGEGQNETAGRPDGFTQSSGLSGFSLPLGKCDILEQCGEGFRRWQSSVSELSFNFLFPPITLGDDSMSRNVMWDEYFKEEFYLYYSGREKTPFSDNVECINWGWASIL